MKAKHRAQRMILQCGIPEDAVIGCARVTLSGRSSVLVEHQRGVVEMSETRIRFKSKNGILNICGTGLILQELSLDAAMVSGKQIDHVGYDIR